MGRERDTYEEREVKREIQGDSHEGRERDSGRDRGEDEEREITMKHVFDIEGVVRYRYSKRGIESGIMDEVYRDRGGVVKRNEACAHV